MVIYYYLSCCRAVSAPAETNLEEDTKLVLASILAWILLAYGFWQVWSLVRIKTEDWKALRDRGIKAAGGMVGAWILFLQLPY